MRKNYQLEKRKYVVGGFLVVIAAIYLIRLFGLQIQDDRYKDYADNNAFLRKTVYPRAAWSMTATIRWWCSISRPTT